MYPEKESWKSEAAKLERATEVENRRKFLKLFLVGAICVSAFAIPGIMQLMAPSDSELREQRRLDTAVEDWKADLKQRIENGEGPSETEKILLGIKDKEDEKKE